jgi:hypothetical protein
MSDASYCDVHKPPGLAVAVRPPRQQRQSPVHPKRRESWRARLAEHGHRMTRVDWIGE